MSHQACSIPFDRWKEYLKMSVLQKIVVISSTLRVLYWQLLYGIILNKYSEKPDKSLLNHRLK